MHVNPCLACGACCAHYRVSFYWAETDAGSDNGVPAGMTDKVNDFLVAMKGTHTSSCRCTALQGLIGESVFCSIYDRRASVCREFAPSWENGIHNIRCDQARLARGLAPLRPESWMDPTNFPKAA
jgi:Fe-S-cluster containining protein